MRLRGFLERVGGGNINFDNAIKHEAKYFIHRRH